MTAAVFQPWKYIRFKDTDFLEPNFDNISFSPSGRYGLYVTEKTRTFGKHGTRWSFRVVDMLHGEMYRYSSEIRSLAQSMVTSYWLNENTAVFVGFSVPEGAIYQYLCSIDHYNRAVSCMKTLTYSLRGNFMDGVQGNVRVRMVPKYTSGTPLTNHGEKYIIIACGSEMKLLYYDPTKICAYEPIIDTASLYIRPWEMTRNEGGENLTCKLSIRPICHGTKMYIPWYTYNSDRTPRRRTMVDHFACFNLERLNLKQTYIILDNMKLSGGVSVTDYVGEDYGINYNENYALLYEKPKEKQINIYLQTKKMIVVNFSTKEFHTIKAEFETSSFPTLYQDKVLLWADNGNAKFRYFELSPKPSLATPPSLLSICRQLVLYDRICKKIPDHAGSVLFPTKKNLSTDV